MSTLLPILRKAAYLRLTDDPISLPFDIIHDEYKVFFPNLNGISNFPISPENEIETLEMLLVYVSIDGGNDKISSITDSNGDTYTKVGSGGSDYSASTHYIYICTNPTPDNSKVIYINYDSGLNFFMVNIIAINGVSGYYGFKFTLVSNNGNILQSLTTTNDEDIMLMLVTNLGNGASNFVSGDFGFGQVVINLIDNDLGVGSFGSTYKIISSPGPSNQSVMLNSSAEPIIGIALGVCLEKS